MINKILEMRAYQAGINHWGLLSRRMAPYGDKRQADVWGGLGGEEERRRGGERMERESGKGWEERRGEERVLMGKGMNVRYKVHLTIFVYQI